MAEVVERRFHDLDLVPRFEFQLSLWIIVSSVKLYNGLTEGLNGKTAVSSWKKSTTIGDYLVNHQ